MLNFLNMILVAVVHLKWTMSATMYTRPETGPCIFTAKETSSQISRRPTSTTTVHPISSLQGGGKKYYWNLSRY